MTVHALLFSAQVAARDTVVFVAARDGFDVMIAVAAAFVALTFLAVLIGLLVLFFQARAAVRAIDRARKGIAMDPAVESLRKTAAHVEGISAAVRGEAERLTASIGQLSDRLTQASDRMEERIEEFNALMEVVQSEAEHTFVDTAAAARGVRRGLGELGTGRNRRARPPSRTLPSERRDGPHSEVEAPPRHPDRVPPDAVPDDLLHDD
jgi:hypothetical protein